ncbi:MAG: HAMP domain-containing histidine kinase [Elusimicrobia bacterium]|nr:HAMP domain-containing histidine kinase [Elusimicrobiota bacterium]
MTAPEAFAAGAAVGGLLAALAVRRWDAGREARQARLFSFAMHEINTPVTAVNMTVINLLGGIFGEVPADQLKWLEMTRDQVGRLGAIVGELRDLVHLEMHRDLKAHLLDADPAELVEEALSSLRRGFHHAGVELAVELEPGLPRVRVDADRAPRSLASLLYHARKFRASGPVALRVRRAGAGVACEVSYRSARLTPDDARASLDLYYPARRRRDQVLSATGVGLGLVRALARGAGGDLEFAADAGGGARLTLTWPLVEAS